jgi:hypothetical protein
MRGLKKLLVVVLLSVVMCGAVPQAVFADGGAELPTVKVRAETETPILTAEGEIEASGVTGGAEMPGLLIVISVALATIYSS